MGDKYNAYMDEIASKSGWKEVCDYRIKTMNKEIRQEALSSMSLVMSAQSEVNHSKKQSAAMVGGAVSEVAGPAAGLIAAYHTESKNKEKFKKS